MRGIVTGGAGFIGSQLVDRLLSNGPPKTPIAEGLARYVEWYRTAES